MWTSFETKREPTASGGRYVARIANPEDKAVKSVRLPQDDPRDQPGTHHPHIALSPDRYLVEYDCINDEVILTFSKPVTGEVAL